MQVVRDIVSLLSKLKPVQENSGDRAIQVHKVRGDVTIVVVDRECAGSLSCWQQCNHGGRREWRKRWQ